MGRRRRSKSAKPQEPAHPKVPLTPAVEKQIRMWAEEAAEAHDLRLYDVEVKAQWLIRVFVDHPTVSAPGEGVTVAECSKVSRYLEAFLDDGEGISERYTLEVSSPGIERPLKAPHQWAMSVGSAVRIVLRNPRPEDGQNVLEGKLIGFEDDVAAVSVEEGGASVTVALEDIARARTTYDFAEK